MPLYSSNNGILDTQKFDYLDSGGCANIYKCDDIVLKIYLYECKYRYYLSRRMFNLLKKNRIPNMVELLDYYHRYTGKIDRLLPMDAYTMKLVKGNRVDILDQKRYYLEDVIKQLEETIESLVKLRIIIEDPSSNNIIFTENGATIIDPDQFIRTSFLTKRQLYEKNKSKVITYFNKTIGNNNDNDHYRFITPEYNTSLSDDFNKFLKEETINETIKKNIYKSI